MRAAIVSFDKTGQGIFNTYVLNLIARAYLLAGRTQAGLDTATEALDSTRLTGQWYLDSELHRVRGELLRAAGATRSDIEDDLLLALEIAKRQQAKTLELLAAVELTRWHASNKAGDEINQSLKVLADVYDWFTEGHQTPDLAVGTGTPRRTLVTPRR